MLSTRQKELLRIIIEVYVKEAEPIASQFLVGVLKEKVSPATIRNEMVELENSGYIYQPHTSAGRVPTELGYQYYVDNFLEKNRKLTDKDERAFKKNVIEKTEERLQIKSLAKLMAELSEEAVFVAFTADDNYYTGLSNLFAQPEFCQQNAVVDISQVIDSLDNLLTKLNDNLSDMPAVFIGKHNPLSENCSLIAARYQGSNSGIIGVVGPMRLDYNRCYALIKKIISLIR